MNTAMNTAMNTPHDPDDSTLAELRAINARFIHNYVTNDVRSHDDLLHPDFVCIQSSGGLIGRADYLRYWATAFDPEVVVYWDVRDEFISVYGDVALVRSTNQHTIVKEGREITGRTRYTDTYLRTQAGWKCVQAQLTPVTAAAAPGEAVQLVSVYLKGQKVT